MLNKNYITEMLVSELNALKEQYREELNSKDNSLEGGFKKNLLPGRIVEFDIKGESHFGFILESDVIVYVNKQGQIKGYLSHYTKDIPYKIQRILIPNNEQFQLKNYNKMTVVWERPKEPIKVKKTLSDIEKELGLKPGTLEVI